MGAGLRTTLIAMASCATFACSSGGNGGTTTTSGTSAGTGGTALPGLDGGSACGDGGDCASTSCLGGRCCNDPCPVADSACAATGCDETGTCIYPGPSLSCGNPTCQGPISVSQRVCDGNGDCVLGSPAPCPTNYACNPTTSECNQICLTDLDCDPNVAFCDPTGSCASKLLEGSPCLESAACASRTCLGGYCCATQFCPSAGDTNCPAIACGYDGGGCLYPTCAGSLGCGVKGGTTCLTRCGSTVDCVADSACDPSTGLCCPGLSPGLDFYVDGFDGNDNGCCGNIDAPCQTLTRAMDRLSNARIGGVSGATLHAFNSNHDLDWTSPERWPVHLGLGVTLVAPNLYFDVTNPGGAVFQVYGYSANDVAPVTVEGDPALNGVFTHIGFTSHVIDPPNAGAAFDCGQSPPVALNISNAWLAGTYNVIIIGAGSIVTAGPLPVAIGSNGGQRLNLAGSIGINCRGLPGKSAELTDLGSQALRIDCEATAIAAGDSCTVGLFHSPALGFSGNAAFNICPQTIGLSVSGAAQAFFGTPAEPGLVRWFYTAGVQLSGSDAGVPSLNLSADVAKNGMGAQVSAGYLSSIGSTFSGNSGSGAEVYGGFLAATASSFTSNLTYGVFATGGSLDLGGDGGLGSVISCNGYQDVVNAAPLGVGAERVAWDNWDADAGVPTLWRCPDAGLTATNCWCVSGKCPPDGGPPDPDAGYPPVFLPFGLDAVDFDYNAGTLDYAEGTQAPLPCH